MKKNIIVAMAEDNVIGNENKLPWSLPADLKRFKKITLGYPIIMGRKTFESIGRALPHRENIVITSNPDKITQPGIKAFSSIAAALAYCEEKLYPQVFFIGGANLYSQVMDLVDGIILTQINAKIPGDAFFPKIDYKKFKITSLTESFSDKYSYSFIDLEKVKDE